jgi:hypothetical protein
MKLSLDATQTNCSFVSIAYEVNLHAGHQVEPLLFQNVVAECTPTSGDIFLIWNVCTM